MRQLLDTAAWPDLWRESGRFVARRWRLLLFALVCLIGPLWGFAELADDVRDGAPFEFDEPFLRTAQAAASPALDRSAVLASEVGYKIGVIPLDLLIVLLLLATKRVRKAVFFALAVGGSALINLGTKLLFARDRPSLWETIVTEHSFSFPSGHAMGSMTLAVAVVMLLWPTHWRWPAVLAGLAFAVWVGGARVYLGVHYPSDILAGWVVSIAWTTIVYLSVRPHRHTREIHDADPGSEDVAAAPEETGATPATTLVSPAPPASTGPAPGAAPPAADRETR